MIISKALVKRVKSVKTRACNEGLDGEHGSLGVLLEDSHSSIQGAAEMEKALGPFEGESNEVEVLS